MRLSTKYLVFSLALLVLRPTFAELPIFKNPGSHASIAHGKNLTILVSGDSLVAGYRAGQESSVVLDVEEGAPLSAVGVLAKEIAAHYPEIKVELILRSPGIDTNGVSNCQVIPEQRRIVQSPPSAKQTIRIIRDGVGGNNALRLLARWNKQEYLRFPKNEIPLEHWRADIVILMLGVNDSLGGFSPLECYPSIRGKNAPDLKTRGEPTEIFAMQLNNIVARVRGMQRKPELFLATPPIGHFWGRESAERYAEELRKVALKTRTHLIDAAQEMETGTAGCAHDWYRGGDCIHLSDKGYEMMGKILFQGLLKSSR